MPTQINEIYIPNPIPLGVEEALPLSVVPDWDDQLKRANAMAKLIDRHLNYEECGRTMLAGERLTPIGLCPEQRVAMVTDLLGSVG